MKQMMIFLMAGLFTVAAQAEFKAGIVDMQKAIQSTSAGKRRKKNWKKSLKRKWI